MTGERDVEGSLTVDPSNAKGGVKQPRKQRGPPEDGVPSKTKIMVANLPYDLGEEKVRAAKCHSSVFLHKLTPCFLQLMEIFEDYKPLSAKIALRPIPKFMVRKLQARGEQRKGRGFGFVTMPTEEAQQKACADMNGKEIEGREIAVKVAIDSPGKEDGEPAEGEVGGEAEDVAPSTAEGSGSLTTAPV